MTRAEARYTLTSQGEAYLAARDLSAPGGDVSTTTTHVRDLVDLLDEASALPGSAKLRAFADDLRGGSPRGPAGAALKVGALLAVLAKCFEAHASALREGAVDDGRAVDCMRTVATRLCEALSLVDGAKRALTHASRAADNDGS